VAVGDGVTTTGSGLAGIGVHPLIGAATFIGVVTLGGTMGYVQNATTAFMADSMGNVVTANL